MNVNTRTLKLKRLNFEQVEEKSSVTAPEPFHDYADDDHPSSVLLADRQLVQDQS